MRRSFLSPLIVLLLLGNLVFFVWSQGYLAPFGFSKKDLGEPERLARQLHSERITLVPPSTQATARATSVPETPSSAAQASPSGGR